MARLQGDLKGRSFEFAKGIPYASDALPNNVKGWTLARQLIRSGTSFGANLREADNAYTESDFCHRCNVARKESSETQYWIELCVECGVLPQNPGLKLATEADELTRVLSAIVKKVQTRLNRGSK